MAVRHCCGDLGGAGGNRSGDRLQTHLADPENGGISKTGAALALIIFAGVLLIGTIPNFLHAWIEAHFKSRLRSSTTFFSNHDLSKAVGQSLRLILLDAADPQAGDQLPRVASDGAREWLRDHADQAPELWQTLVTVEAGKPTSEYKGLFEPNLWTFVERRDAPALPDWAWKHVLRHLNGGKRLPFESDVLAMKAILDRLNARFGEALWEYTKHDFVNGGAEAEALHLLIASQLLERTTAMAEGIEALRVALADLANEWTKQRAAVTEKVDRLMRHQAWAIRLLVANTETLSRIEAKIDVLTQQHAHADRTNRDSHDITHKKLDEIAHAVGDAAPPPPTNNLSAANVPDNAAKFKGRIDDLAELHRRVTTDPDGVPIPVVAAPGLGKSAFVTRYVFLHQRDFDHVWWLRASNPKGNTAGSAEERSLAALLDLWGIASKAIQGDEHTSRVTALADQVRAWLSRPKADGTPARHLLVLDNVDDYATVKRLRLNAPSRVIFTARAAHLARDGARAMELRALSQRDGLLVLRSKTDKWNADMHTAPLTEMGVLVGWNALALVCLAAVLARPSTQEPAGLRAALATALATGRTGPMSSPREDERPDDHDQKVEEAFALFIAPYAGTPEMTLLDAAALCAPDDIALDLLRDASGLRAEGFGAALDELVSAGVLDLDGDSVNIHRLTQASVRASMATRGEEAEGAALERLLDALIVLFADIERHQLAFQRTAALAHVDAVLAQANAVPRDAVEGAAAPLPRTPTPATLSKAARLRSDVAFHLRLIGQLADAARHIDAAIAWGEAQTPRDERSLAIWYASRASIRQVRGDLQGAEEDIKRSIDWGEAQTPRDERSLAIDYASRASIRQHRGDLQGAEEDIKRSIDWGEAQTPRDERSLAIDYASRARIREAQAVAARAAGDAARARERFDQAKADIAHAVAWFEENLPSDVRSIGILREVQVRIDKAVSGE